jgi:excisionase family DNA binding protein
MKEETKMLIEAALKLDSTVSQQQRTAILRSVSAAIPPRKFIDAKEACKLLDVSRPTLRALASKGVVEQVNLTTRKVRVDRAQVLEVANNGVCKGVISSK